VNRPALTRPQAAGAAGPGEPDGRSEVTTIVVRRAGWRERLRRVRRSSRRWRVIGPVVVLLLAAVAAWFVWSGPVLVVKDVTVRGAPVSGAAQVRSAARLPMGRPLARLDLAAAERRVAAIRWVRSAEVGRSWPTGVTISVTVRTPVAVVKDAQGRLHLADSTGTAYAEVSSAPADVPLVNADANDPAAVQSVVRVLAGIPARLRAQVTSAEATSPDAVTLTIGQATVLWGGPEESPMKATVLQALRHANPGAHRFDLSAPRAPSVG
jgi:cell division protein FtsQ